MTATPTFDPLTLIAMLASQQPKQLEAATGCVICGTTLTGRRTRYCSRRCSQQGARLTARGKPLRPPPSSDPCTCQECDTTFRPGIDADIKATKFCSHACKQRWHKRAEEARIRAKTRRRAAKRKIERSRKAPNLYPNRGPLIGGTCIHCGSPWVSRSNGGLHSQRFCSIPCCQRYNRQEAKRRRRGRESRGYVRRSYIYQRDQGICRICHTRVHMAKTVPHPKAPTLDHIIPLAVGGWHGEDNVQLAHFECNYSKGDGHANDQLRLIS